MVDRGLNTAGATLAALALAAAALAGCEQRPTPPPVYEEAGDAPRATELAGAAPADAPPLSPEPPPRASEAPPPPPPPPPRGRGDEVIYDLGPVVPAPATVTMAPIPNPPENARVTYRETPPDRRAVVRTLPAPPFHLRRRAHARHAVAGTPTPRAVVRHAAPVARPVAPVSHAAAVPPARKAAGPAPAPRPATASAGATTKPVIAAKPAAPMKPAVAAKSVVPAKPVASASAQKSGSTTKHGKVGAKAKVDTDKGAKLQALQTALRDAVSAKAQLAVPRLAANTPGDVVLTLPADFAQTVRTEAEKAGLADGAASVNLTAALSGEGYAVTPDEVQAQPLTVGQPTEFHWTVTAQPGARGPLRADVGADLLGGGRETLALGAVTKSAAGGGISPRALGAGLLVLIVVAVLAWLSRGGRSRRSHEPTVRRSALSGDHSDRPSTLNGDPRRTDPDGRPLP